jgi:hypothetical protein
MLVPKGSPSSPYLEAKRNGGAPGSDAETFEMIEAQGRGEFLTKLAEELRADAYHPRPYRRREIPKEGGKVRVISIPAIRDRVVQGALRPILEKTRLVTITEPGASFAFLGFEFRWERSSKTGTWYSNRTPRPRKVIAVLPEVGKILRRSTCLCKWRLRRR